MILIGHYVYFQKKKKKKKERKKKGKRKRKIVDGIIKILKIIKSNKTINKKRKLMVMKNKKKTSMAINKKKLMLYSFVFFFSFFAFFPMTLLGHYATVSSITEALSVDGILKSLI